MSEWASSLVFARIRRTCGRACNWPSYSWPYILSIVTWYERCDKHRFFRAYPMTALSIESLLIVTGVVWARKSWRASTVTFGFISAVTSPKWPLNCILVAMYHCRKKINFTYTSFGIIYMIPEHVVCQYTLNHVMLCMVLTCFEPLLINNNTNIGHVQFRNEIFLRIIRRWYMS